MLLPNWSTCFSVCWATCSLPCLQQPSNKHRYNCSCTTPNLTRSHLPGAPCWASTAAPGCRACFSGSF